MQNNKSQQKHKHQLTARNISAYTNWTYFSGARGYLCKCKPHNTPAGIYALQLILLRRQRRCIEATQETERKICASCFFRKSYPALQPERILLNVKCFEYYSINSRSFQRLNTGRFSAETDTVFYPRLILQKSSEHSGTRAYLSAYI